MIRLQCITKKSPSRLSAGRAVSTRDFGAYALAGFLPLSFFFFSLALNSEPTSSIIAISAPSPLRGPSLTIRVYPPLRSANRGATVSNSRVAASSLVRRPRALLRAARVPLLSQSDQLLDKRPELFGLGGGGPDPFFFDQRGGQVSQEHLPVGRGPPQLSSA